MWILKYFISACIILVVQFCFYFVNYILAHIMVCISYSRFHLNLNRQTIWKCIHTGIYRQFWQLFVPKHRSVTFWIDLNHGWLLRDSITMNFILKPCEDSFNFQEVNSFELKMQVFWHMAGCCWANSSQTIWRITVCSSLEFTDLRTWWHIPEVFGLQQNWCENLKWWTVLN